MLGSKIQILFNILTYLVIVLFLLWNRPERERKVSVFLIISLMLLFCVFSFWGADYFHYLSGFNESNFRDTHLEPVYIYLAHYSPSYSFWRLIVWGGALSVTLLLFKRLEIDEFYILLTFAATSLLFFSYARVSLSLSFLFLGYYLLFDRRHIIVGLALLILSYAFHRSALFGIVMAIMSLVLPVKNFKLLLLYTIVFGVAAYYFLDWTSAFMELDADYEDTLGQAIVKGQRYLNKDESLHGLGGLLRDVLTRGPMYFSLLIFVIMICKKEIQWLPNHIIAFSSLSFLMILAGTLFLFNTNFNTAVVYDRFLQFSAVPSSIFLSYCYMSNIHKKFSIIAIIIGILGSVYTLLYAYHCA